ncbi:AMP-binding protein [Sphingosinicella microcystinivorans]|uniref:AMP-binding protein n=1 Tax=Sphingosinicella microcystinivorans TaxID=335406 RepID=UPI0022F3DDCC|nr:AMP-binding protein [Sphingosinicella microcystinivorans]WBX85176.1 AMP-binding protein [Sphingosinicella microcystinivorans]
MSPFDPDRPLPAHLVPYKRSGAWRETTLAALARAHAEAAPDSEVIAGCAPAMTAGRASGEAEALAAALQELGLRPGDRIAFQLPNWEETVVIALALAMGGFVAVPIVPIYRDAEMLQMLADCGCRALFLTPRFRSFDYAAMAERIAPRLPDLRHVVFVRGEGPGHRYDDLLDAGRGRVPADPGTSPDAAKLLLYTSGTTGRPKGVLHSQNTLNAVLDMCVRHWGIRAGETILMPSPVTHLTGYGFLELPFLVGSRTLLMESWNAAEAARLIDMHGVVGTVSATPFLVELTEAAEAAGTRLPSLRFFACGGAAVPPGVIRRANAAFARAPAFRIFGCTEAPLISMGFLGTGTQELAATTDGRVEDYEVRVLDEQDRPLPPGREGEIAARGPAMLLGYLDADQTAAALTADGFYRTGDLGLVTDENAVVITGRRKDLIIRGGENISAKEIEDVLHRHPQILEAAVVAMPHPRLGEGVCAFVVPASGAALDTQALLGFVAEAGLARQKIPERVEFREALVKTPTGKVRKDLLRAEIRDLLAGAETASAARGKA